MLQEVCDDVLVLGLLLEHHVQGLLVLDHRFQVHVLIQAILAQFVQSPELVARYLVHIFVTEAETAATVGPEALLLETLNEVVKAAALAAKG